MFELRAPTFVVGFEMIIQLPFPLLPHHFENDLQLYDPAEVDSHYSAEYLAQRAEFEQEIAAIAATCRAAYPHR